MPQCSKLITRPGNVKGIRYMHTTYKISEQRMWNTWHIGYKGKKLYFVTTERTIAISPLGAPPSLVATLYHRHSGTKVWTDTDQPRVLRTPAEELAKSRSISAAEGTRRLNRDSSVPALRPVFAEFSDLRWMPILSQRHCNQVWPKAVQYMSSAFYWPVETLTGTVRWLCECPIEMSVLTSLKRIAWVELRKD